MKTLWQDLRYAVRMLWKSPGFTLVAVVALALGIGANAAIFSVVNGVLLRRLPFADEDRLVVVKSVNVKGGEEQWGGVSPADFLDWDAQKQSLQFVAAYSGDGHATLTGGEQPEQFPGARVSNDFFNVLGVNPQVGRTFAPEEYLSGGSPAIVLSHRLWQRRFGGDPRVVGQSLTLNGKSTTVVGVMPAEFKHPAHAEVWRPMARDSSEMKLRANRYYTVIARLKPEATPAAAQAEMGTIAGRLEAEHAQSNAGWGARLVPLGEHLTGDVRPALLILFGAVALVLLIACANVANLLLARGSARHKEVAVRLALGASRWRIVRQLLTESVLLSLVGGVGGLLLALWGVEAITALIPEALHFPRQDEIGIDAPVLGFTLAVSVLTGIVFGLLPGWKASQPALSETLKEGGRSSTAGLRLQRLRGSLVVAEVALTLALLVGAGLLMRSFVRLQRVDPGFDTRNLLTLYVSVPPKYAKQNELYFRQVVERLNNTPDVESAAAITNPPLAGGALQFPFSVEGRTPESGDSPQAAYSSISPNYFRAMSIPLRTGREFTERDGKEAPKVAIINETMARRFFPAGDALGKRVKIDYLGGVVPLDIVGVAADVKQGALDDAPESAVYVSNEQLPWFSTALVVRTKADPDRATRAVQEAVWSLNRDQPIKIKRMDALLGESVAEPRLYTLLLGSFAFVALVIAAVGIYGVMAYSVTQRTHEIGIRMALGAQTGDVLRLVLRQGMMLTLIGIAVGLASAFLLTRVMSSLLFQVSATDPAIFVLIPLLLATVALLACYIPARRAMRVDPMVALRYE